MAKQIKDVFSTECKNLKLDSRLVRELQTLEKKFVNRSQDHITFFGGVLLGTPPMRFLPSDRNAWFDEILEVDDVVLRNELHALPTVYADRNVSSDEFNLSVVWLVHALFNSSSLSASQKEHGMIAALRYLHYRFLGSLMSNYFKYEPDRGVAEATYAALNFKYALKNAGSWSALIQARCEDIVSTNSIHYRTIQKFDDDNAILYMITDIQGRIREIVKKMVKVFYEVKESGGRITSRSSVVDVDGELRVRDLTRKSGEYKNYLHTTLKDRNTFVRAELVKIIADAMHTMPDHRLVESLNYMVDNYGYSGDKHVEELVNETLLHAFEFMQSNPDLARSGINITEIITRLRSLYMSSRSTDPALMKMRDLSMGIAKHAIKSTNTSLLSSVRTGIMLYIVLRTLTMKYYT